MPLSVRWLIWTRKKDRLKAVSVFYVLDVSGGARSAFASMKPHHTNASKAKDHHRPG